MLEVPYSISFFEFLVLITIVCCDINNTGNWVNF